MKTVLNLKIDKETKEQAASVAEDMGLTLSAVVNGFLKHYVQTRELHLSANPRITPYLEKVAERARKDYAAGKNISKPLTNSEEIRDYFKKLMK